MQKICTSSLQMSQLNSGQLTQAPAIATAPLPTLTPTALRHTPTLTAATTRTVLQKTSCFCQSSAVWPLSGSACARRGMKMVMGSRQPRRLSMLRTQTCPRTRTGGSQTRLWSLHSIHLSRSCQASRLANHQCLVSRLTNHQCQTSSANHRCQASSVSLQCLLSPASSTSQSNSLSLSSPRHSPKHHCAPQATL